MKICSEHSTLGMAVRRSEAAKTHRQVRETRRYNTRSDERQLERVSVSISTATYHAQIGMPPSLGVRTEPEDRARTFRVEVVRCADLSEVQMGVSYAVVRSNSALAFRTVTHEPSERPVHSSQRVADTRTHG